MPDAMMTKNILFTGSPGCGKSTVIEKIVQSLDRPATGFFTKEIRERGRRVGFSITTIGGRDGVLAHIDIHSDHRVGKYGVNLEDFDEIAVTSMKPANKNMVVIIDEIGKMECLSALFRQTLLTVLDSENTVVGSIAMKGDAFISDIKKRTDTDIVVVSRTNRDLLPGSYLTKLQED